MSYFHNGYPVQTDSVNMDSVVRCGQRIPKLGMVVTL